MEFILQTFRSNFQFFKNILWTDTSYRKTSNFKMHNLYHWVIENPRIIRNNCFQHQFDINLWYDQLIESFKLSAPVRAEDYLMFYKALLQLLPEVLDEVPLHIRVHMWFQHDGTLAHNARAVR